MPDSTLVPSPNDLAFAKVVLAQGLVRPVDLHECFNIQKQESADGRPKRRVREILLDRGILLPDQVRAVTAAARFHVTPERFGPYAIVGFIAKGGMGVVCRATHLITGQWVALKIMVESVSKDPELLARFRREAVINMRLKHPNIVRTLDMGEHRGKQYIAMELVDGEDLSQVLAQRKALSEKEALAIVHSVALALEHAHAMGLVHRDVKPGNILFTRTGQIKLADFGLVKDTDPEATVQTRTGQVLGTPNYISPEQARGEPVIDHRSDIYSLGATLYHMVTGQPPFKATFPMVLLAKHMNEEPAPPGELAEALSSSCAAIIARMMAKKKDDRYQSPRNLIEDIEAVLAGGEPDYAPEAAGTGMPVARKKRPVFRREFRAFTSEVPATDREANARRESRTATIQSILIAVGAVVILWAGCLLAYLSLAEGSRSVTSFILGVAAGGGTLIAVGYVIGRYFRCTEKPT